MFGNHRADMVMQIEHPHPRWRIGIVLVLLTMALACGGLGAAGYVVYGATDYPGATSLGGQTLTRYSPNFVIRRTIAYRTTDPFNKVYNWYSKRFALGPESYAQSNCILMSKSKTLGLGFDEQMSVMICGTPNDQMMFVMRALVYHYPRL
jgi:hypothetical protein